MKIYMVSLFHRATINQQYCSCMHRKEMYLLRQTTPTVTMRTPMTSAIPSTIAIRTPVHIEKQTSNESISVQLSVTVTFIVQLYKLQRWAAAV